MILAFTNKTKTLVENIGLWTKPSSHGSKPYDIKLSLANSINPSEQSL